MLELFDRAASDAETSAGGDIKTVTSRVHAVHVLLPGRFIHCSLPRQALERPYSVSPIASGRYTRLVGQQKECFPILGLTGVGGGEFLQPERPIDGNRVGRRSELCGEPEADRGDVFQCGSKGRVRVEPTLIPAHSLFPAPAEPVGQETGGHRPGSTKSYSGESRQRISERRHCSSLTNRRKRIGPSHVAGLYFGACSSEAPCTQSRTRRTPLTGSGRGGTAAGPTHSPPRPAPGTTPPRWPRRDRPASPASTPASCR
jgi:hypothetical protein